MLNLFRKFNDAFSRGEIVGDLSAIFVLGIALGEPTTGEILFLGKDVFTKMVFFFLSSISAWKFFKERFELTDLFNISNPDFVYHLQ